MQMPEDMTSIETEQAFQVIEEVDDELGEFDDDLSRLSEVEAERDQLREQLMRSLADLQNFRKRAAQEQESSRRYSNEEFMRSLIPVLDNFERTVASLSAGADPAAILQGITMVKKQLQSVLESNSMTRIPAVGSHFDPEIHDAIAVIETTEFEPDTVVDEIEPGYTLFGRVLRPARVRIARAPSE
ncbi:MAG: nucleotide exchange factor GrpE [Armatimonadetes bacterium]|nr:nucleotide exchange factor GrpE [Armatimonadota bacterium]